MTEQEVDQAHQVYELLSKEIKKIVNFRLSTYTPEQARYVRDCHNDYLRFWG
mgnify:CR=1 FL=1